MTGSHGRPQPALIAWKALGANKRFRFLGDSGGAGACAAGGRGGLPGLRRDVPAGRQVGIRELSSAARPGSHATGRSGGHLGEASRRKSNGQGAKKGPPQPAVTIIERALRAGEQLQHKAPRSLHARHAAAAREGPQERSSGGVPALVGGTDRQQLAERPSALLEAGPGGDGAEQRPLRADRGDAGQGAQVEPVRADQSGDARAAPAGPQATAAPAPAPTERWRARRAGRRFAGPGHVDLVPEPSDGGSVASIVAQAKAAGVGTLFDQELRRLDQLLEPVQQTARGRSCTRRA